MNGNVSTVEIDLLDVFHKPILDPAVEVAFYNQRSNSLSQTRTFAFTGAPVRFPNLAAGPEGLAKVVILPSRYLSQEFFFMVRTNANNLPIPLPANTCFLDPQKVSAEFPPFSELQDPVAWPRFTAILQASGKDETAWDQLHKLERACFFNLYAKMRVEKTATGDSLLDYISRVDEFHQDRIFARVKPALHADILATPARFKSASGLLHKFPSDWSKVVPNTSFKSRDDAGNIQLTFARNAAGDVSADIDLDDHTGIKHAEDVVHNSFTANKTHPYNIHQILVFFQSAKGVDPRYTLA